MSQGVEDGGTAFKYWAFISYSHQDDAVARWLHRELERFRVPRRLRGRPSRDGGVPARVFPVFRDREELPGSSSLGDKIDLALRGSRHLVVVCSSNAAVSRWVNQEIRAFKALGRSDRVLGLIVDGEPGASDNPRSGLLECFPQALRFHVNAAGIITDRPEEPIAADIRPGKETRRDALLKILSGLLEVDFDELKRRDQRRRLWRRIQASALALTMVGLLAGVWIQGHLENRALERAHDRQLADLMVRKAQDAARGGDDASAVFYGAHALRHGLAAGVDPGPRHRDFLSSLTVPAVRQGRLGFSSPVVAAAYTPDGQGLVVGLEDGRVIRHDGDRQTPGPLRQGESPVTALVLSPDGRHLAVGESNGSVWLLDALTLEPERTLREHTGGVTALAFAPGDSGWLASAGADGQVLIQPLGNGKPVRTFSFSARVNALAFSPDGARLALAGDDRALRLIDPREESREGEGGRTLATYAEPLRSLAFSPDGRLLAAGGWDTTIRLLDPLNGRERAVLRGHGKAVESLAFTPDGMILLSGSLDATVRLWDPAAATGVAVLRGHERPVSAVAARPGARGARGETGARGAEALSAGRDGGVALWRLMSGRQRAAMATHAGTVRAVAFSPDGRRLASAGDDHAVRLWEVRETTDGPGWRLSSLPTEEGGHDDAVRGLAYSPDGHRLYSAGRDRRVLVRDGDSGRVEGRIENAHDHWIFGLALSADGRRLASSAYDGGVRLWNAADLTLERRLENAHGGKPVGGVSFSPDGRWLATAGDDRMVRVWEVADARLVFTSPRFDDIARAVAFSPDGQRLSAAGADSRIHVWDTTDWKETVSLLGHHALMIWALAWSPDNRWLASASHSMDRQTVRLWDGRSWRLLDWLSGHRDFAVSVAFSPDGSLLASGGTDGVIRLWNTDPAAKEEGRPLRAFLDAPPWEEKAAEALAREVGEAVGLSLVGSDAVATVAPEAAETALTGRFDR